MMGDCDPVPAYRCQHARHLSRQRVCDGRKIRRWMTMTYDNILYSCEDGIARITLNRPDRMNSFTRALHADLRDALGRVQRDDTARVLLITGAGRGFSAGQDLAEPDIDPEKGADFGEIVDRLWSPLVKAIRGQAVPVVTAVNGVAAGAGCSVALAGDIVVAKQSASFIQSFCKIGLIPDTGGSWILPRLVGTARAMGLALLGDTLSADQAAEWGLIWRSIPDDDFDTEVERLVAGLAKAPTRALALTRRLIMKNGLRPLDEALQHEAEAMRTLGYSDDYREGVAAFMEKRPPQFSGR
jgi:2-(1,2-epoxy-1,2-dihydrophenyl)acetyl-CoA isomerase